MCDIIKVVLGNKAKVLAIINKSDRGFIMNIIAMVIGIVLMLVGFAFSFLVGYNTMRRGTVTRKNYSRYERRGGVAAAGFFICMWLQANIWLTPIVDRFSQATVAGESSGGGILAGILLSVFATIVVWALATTAGYAGERFASSRNCAVGH